MGVRSGQCSCYQDTCRLIQLNMNAYKLLLIVAVGAASGARQLRGMKDRDQRSLVNTFPFNAADGGHHGDHHAHGDDHGHHGDHAARAPSQDLGARAQRQGASDGPPSFDDVAGAEIQDGKRCIDKVEMIEEIEYDDVVQCDHSYDKRCHTTYVTNYDSQQEEECEENSRKPVTKYTPITGCTKEPRELCAPAGCGFKPAPEPTCYDKQQTIVQDAPKETCSLEPQRTCKHVTKLVPKLSPTEECVDVPKEVCTRSRTNPRPVKKPVVKKWCYVPTEESGLA